MQQRTSQSVYRGVWRLCGLLLLILSSFNSAAPVLAEEQLSLGAQVRIVQSTPASLVIELNVNDYNINTIEHDGQLFHHVSIPNTEQTITPGAPQVPSLGALLGVPTTAGVAFEILESDYTTLSDYKLQPAPTLTFDGDDLNTIGGAVQESFILDSKLYTTDTFYPGALVELGEVGYLRDQAVAQLQFYPVQYNPAHHELRIYRHIVVRLTWDVAARQANAIVSHQPNLAFEKLLHTTLLNFDDLVPLAPDKEENLSTVSLVPSTAVAPVPPALKISIKETGIYRLTYADLHNAGFDLSTFDPRTLKMANRSNQVAIAVYGEADGVFNKTDYILFYGVALHDLYTDLNVYWLWSGGEAGQRMSLRNGMPTSNAPMPDHFLASLHLEDDTAYWQNMPGNGEDRWFWGKRLSPNTQDMPTSRPYTIGISKPVRDTTATMRVRLKGYTGLSHHTRIHLNGHLIDDQTWQGQIQFTHTAIFPQSYLKQGDNIVLVETVNSGASVDQILVNWIEIDYWQSYLAENDQLRFSSPIIGTNQFVIDSFTNSDILAFDMTDPNLPIQITNLLVNRLERSYKIQFESPTQANSRYLALASTQFKRPTGIALDQPSSWKSPTNGADYIIITHEDFYASALALANHRNTQGFRVATVKVGDLYDEFNDGIFSPKAIQNFLVYAYQNWVAPAPTYVVLLGDANQDYKDNLKTDTPNYVPSWNIDSTLFGEVSSDNRLVAVNGNDSLPDLFIGRLPVQSPQEAATMVTKVIQYDQASAHDTWNKNVLLVADDDEPRFRAMSEELAAKLPFYYQIKRVYANEYPPGNPTIAIINQINNGSSLVNYAGHGEYFAWGRWKQEQEFIFHVSDVDALQNPGKLPFFTVANCLNGFFAGPKQNASLAEVLLRRENAGAIAIWAPTSLGYPTGHSILSRKLYDAIFFEDQITLGAATTTAKLATYADNSFWNELIETYVLLGDPATQLGIPTNFPYPLSMTPINGASEVTLDENIQITFSKPMDPNTVTIMSNDGENVNFSSSWNISHTVANFTHTPFVHGKQYGLSLIGKDRQGNALGAGLVPNPWFITATTDNTPPVAAITLDKGSPLALTTTSLEIIFSKPVRPESFSYTVTPSVNGSIQWDLEKRKATFIHDWLQVGKTYTFRVLTATDKVGNPLREPVQFSFTPVETFYIFLPLAANSGP